MSSSPGCRWTAQAYTSSGLSLQTTYVSCAGSKTVNGFESCCVNGDVCAGEGICHYTHPLANGSGFYLAGCTDPAYQDSSCLQQCNQSPGPDIVYNATSLLWACCNWDDSAPPARVCSHPSEDTFQASSPQDLLNAVSSSTTVSSPPTVSSQASSSATVSPSSTASAPVSQTTSTTPSNQASTSLADNHESTSLSTGTKAGIGVGVGLGALLLLLLIFWVVVTTRKARKIRGRDGNLDEASHLKTFLKPKAELPGTSRPSELYGDQTRL